MRPTSSPGCAGEPTGGERFDERPRFGAHSRARARLAAGADLDGADDLKEQASNRGRGVDPLVEHDQVDPAGLKEFGELDQMLERAAETVELGDAELVAGAFGDQQRLVQLWASSELAAGVFDEDPLASASVEGVVLSFGMLIARRHPPVPDPHTRSVPRPGEC
jgi:hypothetical protein